MRIVFAVDKAGSHCVLYYYYTVYVIYYTRLMSRGRESCVVIRGHRSRGVCQSFPPTEAPAGLYAWHGTRSG